jgi:uncharacterized protein YndB with AHSA1/START domain
MAKYSISASSLIASPPQRVYEIIADYRHGHPRILPKPYFVSLDVKEGGYGAGTVIDFEMKVMGQVQSFHAVITEPEPGRVLMETDTKSGTVTTFTIDPHRDGTQSVATITTTIQLPEGWGGSLQGWITSRLLRPIYKKELKQLEFIVTEQTSRR